jgi:hypothetical protein
MHIFIYYLLFIIYYLLFIIYYLLFIVYYLLGIYTWGPWGACRRPDGTRLWAPGPWGRP